VAGTDPRLVGDARDGDLVGAYEARRHVPPGLFISLAAKLLDELRVVHPRAEVVLDGIRVGGQPVRGELELAAGGGTQLLHEVVRVPGVSPAQVQASTSLECRSMPMKQ
jgi:hypothetical protein